MGRRGFTRASTLGPIADVIAGAGGSPKRVFSRTDLPLSLLQTPDVFVPLKDHFNLLLQSARELGDELFAARLGQMVSVNDLGTYGKWVVQAPTLLESLDRANRSLTHLLQSATVLSLHVEDDQAIWSYDSKDSASEGRQQNEMLALCFMMEIAREYLGRNWVPERFLLGGSPVHDRGGLEQLIGTSVAFHDGAGSLVFDRRLLATRRSQPPETALSPAELGRSIDVPDPEDLRDTVSALIELELTERLPTMEWVSGKLDVSERTLQRQLEATGSRFAELVQSAVQRRACDLLQGSSRSITSVAFALGYSDAAHFTRAFKRWTGVSPQSWRNRMQGR
jgi:AraC-like DNA-binding protein